MCKDPLVNDSLEELADNTKKASWAILGRRWAFTSILKTGQTEDSFQISGKHFSFRQQLKSFAKRGDNSGLMFLRTTTWIPWGPVAFVESRPFTSFPISLAVTENLLSWLSVSWGKSGRVWPWSSRVELEAKLAANSFAFSEEEEITSGPCMRVGTEAFPLLRTFLEIFQNPRVPGLSLLISVWIVWA